MGMVRRVAKLFCAVHPNLRLLTKPKKGRWPQAHPF
jgi:hypothetical protein